MKYINAIILSFFLLLSSAAISQNRIQLSSETASKSFSFSDYTAIDVASDFKVNVSFAKAQESILVTANDNLIDRVDIYKKGKTLYFRLAPKTNTRGKMILEVQLTTAMIHAFTGSSDALITVNDLIKNNKVTIDLSSDAQFTGAIQANTLSIDVSSDAQVNGKVTVKKCDLKAKSDAIVNLDGSIASLNASLASDSQFKNRNLEIEDVTIKMTGDSQAWIKVTNSLEADASGDSVLKYSGNPRIVNKKVSGDAKITEVN